MSRQAEYNSRQAEQTCGHMRTVRLEWKLVEVGGKKSLWLIEIYTTYEKPPFLSSLLKVLNPHADRKVSLLIQKKVVVDQIKSFGQSMTMAPGNLLSLHAEIKKKRFKQSSIAVEGFYQKKD